VDNQQAGDPSGGQQSERTVGDAVWMAVEDALTVGEH
jgi:hypothetical protein